MPRASDETAEPLIAPAVRQRLRRQLIRWYEANGRPLPWRQTDDAYRIWVSEIMLQQTTVAAVIPYYERFTAAFPTVGSLAAAEEDDVLRLWEGLGYYSRAKNLRRAAQRIVAEHDGRFPSDVAPLRRLPGVGRYTAGAIASFAFDRPAPIVEANTERLYARLIAYAGPLTTAAGKRALWQVAEELVPKTKPGRFNQAVMELGSQICRPKDPKCDDCPVRSCCRAFAEGRVADIPAKKPKAEVTERTEAALVLRNGGQVLIRRRPADEQWAGLWDFPRCPVPNPAAVPKIAGQNVAVLPGLFKDLDAAASELIGQPFSVDSWIASFTHGITRYRIRVLVVAGPVASRRAADAAEHQWVDPTDLDRRPLTRPARRIADLLTGTAKSTPDR